MGKRVAPEPHRNDELGDTLQFFKSNCKNDSAVLKVVMKLQLLALAMMRHKGLGDAGLREIVLEDFVDKIKQKVRELVTRDMDEGRVLRLVAHVSHLMASEEMCTTVYDAIIFGLVGIFLEVTVDERDQSVISFHLCQVNEKISRLCAIRPQIIDEMKESLKDTGDNAWKMGFGRLFLELSTKGDSVAPKRTKTWVHANDDEIMPVLRGNVITASETVLFLQGQCTTKASLILEGIQREAFVSMREMLCDRARIEQSFIQRIAPRFDALFHGSDQRYIDMFVYGVDEYLKSLLTCFKLDLFDCILFGIARAALFYILKRANAERMAKEFYETIHYFREYSRSLGESVMSNYSVERCIEALNRPDAIKKCGLTRCRGWTMLLVRRL